MPLTNGGLPKTSTSSTFCVMTPYPDTPTSSADLSGELQMHRGEHVDVVLDLVPVKNKSLLHSISSFTSMKCPATHVLQDVQQVVGGDTGNLDVRGELGEQLVRPALEEAVLGEHVAEGAGGWPSNLDTRTHRLAGRPAPRARRPAGGGGRRWPRPPAVQLGRRTCMSQPVDRERAAGHEVPGPPPSYYVVAHLRSEAGRHEGWCRSEARWCGSRVPAP